MCMLMWAFFVLPRQFFRIKENEIKCTWNLYIHLIGRQPEEPCAIIFDWVKPVAAVATATLLRLLFVNERSKKKIERKLSGKKASLQTEYTECSVPVCVYWNCSFGLLQENNFLWTNSNVHEKRNYQSEVKRIAYPVCSEWFKTTL